MQSLPAAGSSHVPARELCVLRYVLDYHAERQPDAPFLITRDLQAISYADWRRRVRSVARRLQDLGVVQGDHVLLWLPSSEDALLLWFATNYIGAVAVPINTAYRGRLLEHVVNNSDARLGIVHGQLLERFGSIRLDTLRRIVRRGGNSTAPVNPALQELPSSVLDGSDQDVLPLDRPIEPWDPMQIIYTSGTTGPSKGALISYLHHHSMGAESHAYFRPDDRVLVTLPSFHVGSTQYVQCMLTLGGSISILEEFRTATFWQIARERQVTGACLVGVMAAFLLKEPPSPRDREHALRSVTIAPYNEDAIRFGERFGVDIYTLWGMTEANGPIVSGPNPGKVGVCGRLRPGIEARIVDANDRQTPLGHPGELILRTSRPWSLSSGYYGDSEATARAWKNGWFHTGDLVRIDAEGDYFFCDRLKDAIRRRGENISSFEVESDVCTHPAIREAAVVAVRSEVAEDEVLVAVALVDGARLLPEELIDFLRPKMAHFMLPRYVRILEALPKTPTQKVMKHVIRNAGVTPDTWDRDAHGIRASRERLSN